MNEKKPLIEVNHLKQYFNIQMGMFKSKPLKAVDDVSFTINKGETLGLVGESGCGKTTVGRTMLHLYKPTAGSVSYNGKEIKTKADVNEFRKKATMVFQDPYSSLNPRMTVQDIIGEPLDVHNMYENKAERREHILDLMQKVGLNSEHAARYAHEFSGGQRQRIGIARSLAMNPDFDRSASKVLLVANKVTSATESRNIYDKLSAVVGRFLNIRLEYLGAVPQDSNITKAIMKQKPVSLEYPNANASKAFASMEQRLSNGEAFVPHQKKGVSRFFSSVFGFGKRF